MDMQQNNNNQDQSSSGDDTQVVKSVPSYYVDESLKRGPSYYTYDTNEEFQQLVWKDGGIYVCQQKIGRGKYSQVFCGVNLANGQPCVIKMLKPIHQRKITRQIKLLITLSGHENIIKLVDLVKQHNTFCLVFEKVRSMETKRLFREANSYECKYYLYQLLQGLDYCHSMGIMHRDIKPGNLIVDLDSRRLKILDWGLGEYYLPNRDLNCHVASRYYKPPELLVGYEYYHYSLDIWSFGAVMGCAVFKMDPMFKGSDNFNQLQQINKILGSDSLYKYIVKYNMLLEPEVEAALSVHQQVPLTNLINQYNQECAIPQAIDLLQKVLIYDHDLRPSAQQCMKHKYFDEVRHIFEKEIEENPQTK